MTHVIGKVSVDDAAAVAQILQFGGGCMYVAPGKNDQGVVRLHILRKTERPLIHEQRGIAFVGCQFVIVAAVADHSAKDGDSFIGAAEMDLACFYAEDHSGPGAAAEGVRHQLRFVDHDDIVFFIQVHHLHRGRSDGILIKSILVICGDAFILK